MLAVDPPILGTGVFLVDFDFLLLLCDVLEPDTADDLPLTDNAFEWLPPPVPEAVVELCTNFAINDAVGPLELICDVFDVCDFRDKLALLPPLEENLLDVLLELFDT